MTKSLYNEHEAYTEDGKELSDRAWNVAKELLEEFVARGYTHREVSHVIQSTVSHAESELALRAVLKRRREAKKG